MITFNLSVQRSRLHRLWCGLAHRSSWSLYGGFERPFIYCNECCATAGPRERWANGVSEGPDGRAIDYAHASVSLRVAAEELAAQTETSST